MIQFQNVSKTYSEATTVVDRLDLHVRAGEFVVLLGESGCGKTTTLKLINRLVDKTSGHLTINGKDVESIDRINLRRSIGYVFQGVGLFPHMTVEENVGIVPQLLGWEAKKIKARCEELLALVALDPHEFGPRYPSQLSGGQQQRVGFARALAAGSRILLLDEPFGALDPITRDTLQNELRVVRRQLDLTVVLVTHDMTEALIMADRVAVMAAGRILQIATPRQLVASPVNDYVKTLLQMPKRQADMVEEVFGLQ